MVPPSSGGPMLNLDTRIMRNDEILHAPVGADESVMMSVEAGQYYGLNSVARHVWEVLDQPMTVAQLCEAVTAEFDVDKDAAAADLLPFIEQLREKDILRVAP